MERIDELRSILSERREDLAAARWRRETAGHACKTLDDLDYEVERAERRMDFFWDDYGMELAQLEMIEALQHIPVPERITRRVILPREVQP
jgi:hypothetical protein